MKAMLLAAGHGRRMFPLTLHLAKPAIPVLGRPLVLQILHWLGGHGIEDVVVNLHHEPETLRRVVGDGTSKRLPAVHFLHEPEILGTAGGVGNAATLLRESTPVVVCNSDFLSDIDLAAAVETHRDSGNAATLVLAPRRPGYSIVRTDASGRVVSLAGLPEVADERIAGEHLFTGCQVIGDEVFDRIPSGGPSDIVRDVYRGLASEGRLGAFAHNGFWWEFGSPAQYLEGSLRMLECSSEQLRNITNDHDPVRSSDGVVVARGPGAEVDAQARLAGRIALGYSCYIGSDSLVRDSVVMPEAWIGSGCRLRRCIVGQGAEIPTGFDCEDSILCSASDDDGELPAKTRRHGSLLVHPMEVGVEE